MSAHERDLFRAIVLSGVALVSGVPGCGTSPTSSDTGATSGDAGSDAATLADAGSDAAALPDAPALPDTGANDAGSDAFVAIL